MQAVMKRVRLHDVAKAAGVSAGTVSNYLNQSAPVKKETQEKIQNVIDELGFSRNEIASSLRRNNTKSIGMIVPNVSNPFYATMFQAAETEAQKRGYTISLGNSHYKPNDMEEYVRMFSNKRMDGILIADYSKDLTGDWYSELYPPIVVIDPPPMPLPFSTVGIDNFEASRLLVQYLIKQGHTKIGIIDWSRGDARFNGYKAALEDHNLPILDELIQEIGEFEDDLISQGKREMAKLLKKANFTACYATTDLLAIGAILCAKENGIRIPDDLAIAGFDDISLASIVDPPLTTVAQPIEEMGRIGVELLVKQINEKKPTKPINVILNSNLITRASA